MTNYAPTELEAFVRQRAPEIAKDILEVGRTAGNEADLVAEVEQLLKRFEKTFDLNLRLSRERTLINGRADAVYNRFVIEYEPPRSLGKNPTHRNNVHAIEQVKQYMGELERLDRHKKERLAGVVLDGCFYIFVRFRDDHWRIDDPIPVAPESTETFLRYLLSLSTELALTPENLVRDFGENSTIARHLVSTLYTTLKQTTHRKVGVLFDQWQRQFSEITGWAVKPGNLDLPALVKNFGIQDKQVDALRFFFAMHTYYAAFIKLLAVQIATYYMMPKVGTGLRQQASSSSEDLQRYLEKMERGGIFREFGINNFLEGDFFGWYLAIWNEHLDAALRHLLAELSNYSLVTLDVDPEETRDLLKKLYQNLMPRVIRHALGEYYTPDWLAERLLNQLGYIGEPDKRLLDPACGSGTFLVLALRRLRSYAEEKMLPESGVLESALKNVVGFDLNPLAVISARTNFLLALGDLLKHRTGDISIPVYLADSVLTPSQGSDLFTQHTYSFNTAVGRFSLPKSLIDARYIDILAGLLEQSVASRLTRDQFRTRLLNEFPLLNDVDEVEINVALDLFEQLLDLDTRGINGIWARIIKNAFAPLFAGMFDYVAGNPPWVNWDSLPEEYREQTAVIWASYGLIATKGNRREQFELGKQKRDISTLMTYVAVDKYLKHLGKLGFIITQSVLKTSASATFRRFQIGEKGDHFRILFADDMSAVKPFEGAANRTAVIIAQKGNSTIYPVPYDYWQKIPDTQGLRDEDTLSEVEGKTFRSHFEAAPIIPTEPTSSWLTGRPKAIKSIGQVSGQSAYQARAGTVTWANGVYWLDIVMRRPDGALVMSNITEGTKRKVENTEAVLEADLVYPLLRGREVRKWYSAPSAYILLPHTPQTLWQAISEEIMKTQYPKSFAYLHYFQDILLDRSGYKLLRPGHPFYILANVNEATFAPYKVVWREQASQVTAAVVSAIDGKPIVPDHKLMLIPFEEPEPAHYLCAALNSSPAEFLVLSYAIAIQMDTHLLEHIRIPQFDSQNRIHRELAALSQKAHMVTSEGGDVRQTQLEIDNYAAQLWKLTNDDLHEIQESLSNLSGIDNENDKELES